MNELNTATYSRNTKETKISISVKYFTNGNFIGSSGLGFFDHMLNSFAKHSNMDIILECKGDLDIDDHHTIEDIGICLGKVISESLKNMTSYRRFGHSYIPLDESLSRCVIDLSGRAYTYFKCDFNSEKIGDLSSEMVEEFFRSVANNIPATIHIENIYGKNDHHKCESIFKAFAKSLNIALSINPHENGVPSTKGTL